MAVKKKITKKAVKKVKGVSAKAKKSSVSVKPPRLKKAASSKAPKTAAKKKVSRAKATSKPSSKAIRSTVKTKAVPIRLPKKVKKAGEKKAAVVIPVRPKKKNVGYPKADLAHFRELIVDKIREANEELLSIEDRLMDATSGEYTDEDSTYSMHMAEQGTDAMEREKAFLFASRERKFISHLEDALQRIASGNYGVCINCDNLIDKGRLEAVPHARMCVDCKVDSKKGGE